MGLLSLTLPTIGQPNSTEDSKVRDALSSIQTEFNGNIELTNLDAGLIELLIPTATVLPYAGSTAPSGFLMCDGSAVSRGTYSALFTKIGETFGAGDGSTTFALPDMQGRVPFGKGTHAAVDTLGESDGVSVATRNPKHRHQFTAYNSSGGFGGLQGASNASGAFTMTIGSGGMDDGVPYLVLNYIIKT